MITTGIIGYGLAAGMGFVCAQAPNTIRLYWRFIAVPTGIVSSAALLVLHDEALFSLARRLFVAAVLGLVVGLVVYFGPWRPGGGGDDETPEPPYDPEDHQPEGEPVVDEVASSLPRDAGLDLWADFEAAPPAPAEPALAPVQQHRGRRD
jgi:hypothetical protein